LWTNAATIVVVVVAETPKFAAEIVVADCFLKPGSMFKKRFRDFLIV